MRVSAPGIGDAEESRGPAIDRDEQHLFAALSQPFGPVTQVLDGKPEVAEERGVAKNDGMPGDGGGDAHRGCVVN